MNTNNFMQVIPNNTTPNVSPFDTILTKLTEIVDRLDSIDERLEAIEVRLADIDLDTGAGFEINQA